MLALEKIRNYLQVICDMPEYLPLMGLKKNYFLMSCPFAKYTHKLGVDTHPSCMIRLDSEKACTFYCFACKQYGHLWELFRDYGYYSENKEMQVLALDVLRADTPNLESMFSRLERKSETEEEVEGFIIPDTVMDKYVSVFMVPEAIAYLGDRKVSYVEIIKYDLRWDKHSQRICFPVKNIFGEYVGMVGRILPSGVSEKRYYNYFSFPAAETLGGIQYFSPDIKKVLVVEGFFDLLRVCIWCEELRILPICTWKCNISIFQFKQLLALDKALLICYDSDLAGDKGTKKFQQLGEKHGIQIKSMKLSEGCDPGTLTKEQFLTSYNQTIEKF